MKINKNKKKTHASEIIEVLLLGHYCWGINLNCVGLFSSVLTGDRSVSADRWRVNGSYSAAEGTRQCRGVEAF